MKSEDAMPPAPIRKAPSPSLLPRPLAIVVGVLLAAIVTLSAALAMVATRPTRVIVVPGAKGSQRLQAEQVPDAAVKKFGLVYLYHWDSYTPADIEERSNWVLRFVAPGHQEKVARTLSERAKYVVRAREASQLSLPIPEACEVRRTAEGRFQFLATGVRRTYIAGQEKNESKIRYVVEMESALPSEDDPYGFVVVAQSIEKEADRDAEGKESGRDHGRR